MKKGTLYNPVDKETLYRLRVEGKMSLANISSLLNRDKRTIRKYIEMYGIPYERLVHSLYIELPIDEIIDLYVNKKMKLKEIAEKLFVSEQTISARLRSVGIKMRPRHNHKEV